MNVSAKKALWKLTGNVFPMTCVWVSNAILTLCAIRFVDVYVNLVIKATDEPVLMMMNAIPLVVHVI